MTRGLLAASLLYSLNIVGYSFLVAFQRRQAFVLQLQPASKLYSAVSNDSLDAESRKPALLKEWDLKGLKSETTRYYLRTLKKIGKANEKLSKAQQSIEEVSGNDLNTIRNELKELQERLARLQTLENGLKQISSTDNPAFQSLSSLAEILGVDDKPPPPLDRGKKKHKGLRPHASGPRKPYFIFTSASGVEIRVGRGASDNDELSCNAEHRDADDWWLHVAGMPGSHVVIRATNDDFPEADRQTLLDAATLAVHNSKAAGSGKFAVSYTRCRNVSKPAGAKAGLVTLQGDVATVILDLKAEMPRLDRLTATKS